jgi:PPOX class probable F420-dependent enzyme
MAYLHLPPTHMDLLERPLYGHLATVRPDGGPQSNVMWFAWDGRLLRFTHTSGRQKYRNVQKEPRVSLSVMDPTVPTRFIEVRGTVVKVEPDPDASFYRELQVRYGATGAVRDAALRVVLTVQPTGFLIKPDVDEAS